MGYVVNQNSTPVNINIVNRKGSLIRTATIEANDYTHLAPGEFYLATYENYQNGSPPSIGLVLHDGTNAILIS